MSQSPTTAMLQPPRYKITKGIIGGNRHDDGKHNKLPYDNNDAAMTTMTMAKKMTILMTITTTMTTAMVVDMAMKTTTAR
jgi:hypothetical protein